MEELQELAALQVIVSKLSRHSLTSKQSFDDLLLAKLVTILSQLCMNSDTMSEKCCSMANRLQQISRSSAFLHDLFDDKQRDSDTCQNRTSPANNVSLFSNDGRAAVITLQDLERANSTLEDFCRSYFMFHGLDVVTLKDVFMHFPVLSFVESSIYQIDEQKENLLLPLGATSGNECEDDSFKCLRETLQSRNLLTNRIEKELEQGIHYWRLEHYLCISLIRGDKIHLEDVMQAMELKSFDYRVLNLLLYELLHQPVNELHMNFLSTSELLVEISDDLFDYEEDVLRNSFNILRMFVNIFGPSKAPYLLAQVISDAETKYKDLLEKLEPSLAAKYQSRCQQAVREGGGTCSPSHPMGSWIIPPLITNEQLYRDQCGIKLNTS